MKKLIALLLILCAALPFASCASEGNNDAPAGMQVLVSDKVGGFDCYVPADWTVKDSENVLYAYVSEQDKSNVSVTYYGVPKEVSDIGNYTLDDYWKYYLTQYKDVFGEMTVSEEESGGVALDGVAAEKKVFTAKIGGTEYKYMQIFAIRNGVVYFLTYTSTPDKFLATSEMQNQINAIIADFDFYD